MDFLKYIQKGNFKRINVVGCPGSGKSTTAKFIADKTGYPLFDLDDFLYKKGCKRKSHIETLIEIDKILVNYCFVIDCTYTSSFEYRLRKLDLVILIDKPTIICIYQFLKRIMFVQNLKCGEKLTKKTSKLLFTFNWKNKKELKRLTIEKNISFLRLN
jgi:adenylate kinase family enzyme